MAYSRTDMLENLRFLIGIEISGFHVDNSMILGYCGNQEQCKNGTHIRTPGEKFKVCSKCGKCIAGNRPAKDDGVLSSVFEKYRNMLQNDPVVVKDLRCSSAPPFARRCTILPMDSIQVSSVGGWQKL